MNKRNLVVLPILGLSLTVAGLALAEYNYVFQIVASPEQTVAANGTGDSCAVFYPKDKAEDEAQADAMARAIAKCDVTLAECEDQCIAHGGYDATAVTLVNEVFTTTTFTRGETCGWHATTHVTGDCGCACLHH